MTRATDAVGGYGERVATTLLCAAGMRLLDRNWRCRDGELDIVARDVDGTIVFCEVKTRRSNRYGTPVEAVGPAKVRRMRRVAAAWLAEYHLRGLAGDRSVAGARIRFDVVSVWPQPAGPATVEHLRDAF
jgi:putative endonuclease